MLVIYPYQIRDIYAAICCLLSFWVSNFRLEMRCRHEHTSNWHKSCGFKQKYLVCSISFLNAKNAWYRYGYWLVRLLHCTFGYNCILFEMDIFRRQSPIRLGGSLLLHEPSVDSHSNIPLSFCICFIHRVSLLLLYVKVYRSLFSIVASYIFILSALSPSEAPPSFRLDILLPSRWNISYVFIHLVAGGISGVDAESLSIIKAFTYWKARPSSSVPLALVYLHWNLTRSLQWLWYLSICSYFIQSTPVYVYEFSYICTNFSINRCTLRRLLLLTFQCAVHLKPQHSSSLAWTK